jgi:hypothetical protein
MSMQLPCAPSQLAAGFVFEIDNQFYVWLFSDARKQAYQAAPYLLTCVGSADPRLKQRWRRWLEPTAWALCAVNLGFAILFYYMTVGPSSAQWMRPLSNWYFWVAMWMHARSLVFAVGYVRLQLDSDTFFRTTNETALGSSADRGFDGVKWCRAVGVAALTIALSFTGYNVCFVTLERAIGAGYVFYPREGSDSYTCLQGNNPNDIPDFCVSSKPPTVSTSPPNVTSLGATYSYGWYGAP